MLFKMEKLGTVTCERCGTVHDIVRIDGEVYLKNKANLSEEKEGRKYVISCTKCRAFLYIGDKIQ